MVHLRDLFEIQKTKRMYLSHMFDSARLDRREHRQAGARNLNNFEHRQLSHKDHSVFLLAEFS